MDKTPGSWKTLLSTNLLYVVCVVKNWLWFITDNSGDGIGESTTSKSTMDTETSEPSNK